MSMRWLYVDCSSGASGDMFLAALLDIARQMPNRLQEWQQRFDALLSIEQGSRYELREVTRAGVAALKIDFYVGSLHSDHFHSGHDSRHAHEHRNLASICRIFDALQDTGALTPRVCAAATEVFQILANAEAKVHGTTPEHVHFHEVGALDSILDIAGACLAFDLLEVEGAIASPVTLGSGFVQVAHGTMSVPPPAVAEIVARYNIPISGLELPGECLTPTGAALLAHSVRSWRAALPAGALVHQGVGAGNRDPQAKANILRAFLMEGEN